LLYSKGFREKSHYALLVAVQELFSDKLERSLIQGFEDAVNYHPLKGAACTSLQLLVAMRAEAVRLAR
jgi:hypothetical protein